MCNFKFGVGESRLLFLFVLIEQCAQSTKWRPNRIDGRVSKMQEIERFFGGKMGAKWGQKFVSLCCSTFTHTSQKWLKYWVLLPYVALCRPA